MDSWRAASFRQRARNSERVTRQLKDYRRQRVAVRTHEAIQDFEDHLRAVQEGSGGAIDDLPMDAEAGQLGGHSRARLSFEKAGGQAVASTKETGSDTSSARNRTVLLRTQSETLHSAGRGTGPDVDHKYDQRPPSPLAFYDYGGISIRPRSVLAQRSKVAGESARPAYRQGSCGFYFPGAELRQGPYGFSMQDPIHMPPRGWEPSRETPGRWGNDPGDVRPATTEARDWKHRRSRTAGPAISEAVRSTQAHDRRASLLFRSLDRRNEDSHLEQVRFEAGVFEGRWRDPLLDSGSPSGAAALRPMAATRCGFLGEAAEGALRVQQVASRILFGLEGVMRASRSNLVSIFRAENRGTVGVLEPAEFLEGLIRLGVVQEGELGVDAIIEAMAHIDPSFDGRVSFTALERALAAARGVRRAGAREAERLAQHHEQKLTSSYGQALPIDVVKIERQPKSIFDFERAFEKFRKQQRDLLAHHGEKMH